jgi:hypothetical protein
VLSEVCGDLVVVAYEEFHKDIEHHGRRLQAGVFSFELLEGN